MGPGMLTGSQPTERSPITRSRLLRLAHWQVSRSSGGFTYLGVLIVVAVLGIALTGTGLVWRTQKQRENERELLFVGEQFRRAIGQYYERSPGAKQFPNTLDELLLDPRYPTVQRYLRRPYADPMTGTAQWGLVTGPEGRIVGVYSLSEASPRKQSQFKHGEEGFEGAETYREWKFIYVPAGANPPQTPAAHRMG
jgi:type II secretory pathway pseudopilin PulG